MITSYSRRSSTTVGAGRLPCLMNLEQANFDLSGNCLVAGKLPFRSILQELPRLGIQVMQIGISKSGKRLPRILAFGP
jgi:hypothetical protein